MYYTVAHADFLTTPEILKYRKQSHQYKFGGINLGTVHRLLVRKVANYTVV